MPMMPIATAHEITSPTICMAFLNLKTAKALGHNHCYSVPVGVSEIRHTHPGPLAVYVLEGTLILEHEGRPTTTYKTGDAVLIEAGKVHRGIMRVLFRSNSSPP